MPDRLISHGQAYPFLLVGFPILKYLHHIRHFPKLVRHASRHRRRYFQRLMDAHKFVVLFGRVLAHNTRRGRLFGLFWPLTFAQSHTRTATVLVDEFDAGQFQAAPNRQIVSRRHGRRAVG